MTAETDIAAIADAGDNPPSRVRTALTSVLARADGAWDDWTPSIGGTTTNPNLGDAPEIWGRYIQQGKTVRAMGFVSPGGSGIAAGSGDLRISLPVAATLASHPGLTWAGATPTVYGQAGTFSILNTGAAWLVGAAHLVSTTQLACFISAGAPMVSASIVNVTGDGVMVNLCYEAA